MLKFTVGKSKLHCRTRTWKTGDMILKFFILQQCEWLRVWYEPFKAEGCVFLNNQINSLQMQLFLFRGEVKAQTAQWLYDPLDSFCKWLFAW